MAKQVSMRDGCSGGSAAHQCGKALPFRQAVFINLLARLRLGGISWRRSLSLLLNSMTVRQSLTALRSGRAVNGKSGRIGLQYLFVLLLSISFVAQLIPTPESFAQGQQRSGAHSSRLREPFTAADHLMVERAIGATCAERVRDPLASMPIDQMQGRPSLPVSNPDAVAGTRRAERLLPTTRKLVGDAIVELAKNYDLYSTPLNRSRVSSAIARVDAVKRVKPDVDARDNASVLLREPRIIEFGTIFLAGLRSDEAMISVLGHELTHIASGQNDSLRPLFRAIARRAAARTGLRIQGQRAEELACDLVGVTAAREFIKQTPSGEPMPRRLARAFEHNCVDDDASDEDHLSPRNTIRTLFVLDVGLAAEILNGGSGAFAVMPKRMAVSAIVLTPRTTAS